MNPAGGVHLLSGLGSRLTSFRGEQLRHRFMPYGTTRQLRFFVAAEDFTLGTTMPIIHRLAKGISPLSPVLVVSACAESMRMIVVRHTVPLFVL